MSAAPAWQPRSALVIGASRGLGLALVRRYRAQGLRVVATARDDAGLQALRAEGAQALKLDVRQVASVAGLAWQVDGEQFDAVWYAAGVYGPRHTGLQTPTPAEFDEVMHTNVLGAMQVLPQLLDALAPQARLAVLSSQMGSIGARQGAQGWLYRASKAALNSVLSDCARLLAGRALCVAVHPGWVQTDMGGPEAPLAVSASAADLQGLLQGLSASDNGAFLNHDGSPLPW